MEVVSYKFSVYNIRCICIIWLCGDSSQSVCTSLS